MLCEDRRRGRVNISQAATVPVLASRQAMSLLQSLLKSWLRGRQMRPMLLAPSVNHNARSGPAVIAKGLELLVGIGNS